MLHSFAITKPKGLHSERGPSTAHRWRICTGSVAKSRGIPNEAGMDAAQGTVFHEFAAICLEQDLDPYGFIGAKMTVPPHGVIEFDHEMATAMVPGLDVLRALDGPNCLMIVEEVVSLDEWVGPGEFGTTDCIIIDFDNWRIIAFDWKYGAGVPVSPEYNDQAMLYILGAWSSFIREMWENHLWASAEMNGVDFDPNDPWEESIEVQVMIEQPRAPGGGGTWITTMGEILREGGKIRRDAELTTDPDAPLVPGEKQCKFCPAARINSCEARANFILAQIGTDLDMLDKGFADGEEMEFPKAISPEARSQVLLHRAMIEQYLGQLHKEAYHDAEKGRPTPGLKLVEGRRPNREWVDPVKAEAVLKARLSDGAYKPKEIVSPAEAEKTVGAKAYKSFFAAHVRQGPPKPVLVPDFHNGERIQNFNDMFDDLETNADISNLI